MNNHLKVMIPLDFTEVSYKALTFIESWSEQMQVELHLVHVIKMNTVDIADPVMGGEVLDVQLADIQKEAAAEQFRALRERVSYSFHEHVIMGALSDTLSDLVKEQHIDLLVMGTKGVIGWMDKLAGSEAQHFVRHVQVPVITIHEDAQIREMKDLLWVSDFHPEEHPAEAVDFIKKLQAVFEAKLHLLQILPAKETRSAAELERHIHGFAAYWKLENYDVHIQEDTRVKEGITSFHGEKGFDMLCMGTHARKGLDHLLYGSIAESLVNKSVRPLLTYHLRQG
jgi:nucleotide-binding universal stress UspA family protein